MKGIAFFVLVVVGLSSAEWYLTTESYANLPCYSEACFHRFAYRYDFSDGIANRLTLGFNGDTLASSYMPIDSVAAIAASYRGCKYYPGSRPCNCRDAKYLGSGTVPGYLFDAQGRITDFFQISGADTTAHIAYLWDELSGLWCLSNPSGKCLVVNTYAKRDTGYALTASENHSFTFDASGRLVSDAHAGFTYAFGEAPALQTKDLTSYSYDADGNLKNIISENTIATSIDSFYFAFSKTPPTFVSTGTRPNSSLQARAVPRRSETTNIYSILGRRITAGSAARGVGIYLREGKAGKMEKMLVTGGRP
jgi:hypothetical protein